MPSPPPAGQFASTRWSIVRAAADGPSGDRGREALAALYEIYWRPVYAFLRRAGLGQADAEDLCQEFYARLLGGKDLAAADPDRGRFRTYLLTCLQHFLSNHRRAARAHKRGGDRALLSLDAGAAEAWHTRLQSDLDPVRSFERAWALTLLDRVMAQLRQDYETGGRGEVFDALKPVLTAGRGGVAYADLADRLGTSAGAIRVAVHKLRQRFGEMLRREIAETVTSAEAVEAEIRDLFAALG